MSIQVEFYMTDQDEAEFVDLLVAQAQVLVYPTYSESPSPLSLSRFDFRKFAKLSLANGRLQSRVLTNSAGENRFSVDVYNCEVVYWNRWQTQRTDGKKDPGCLGYHAFGDGKKKKRLEFLAWANSVVSMITRRFHRSDDHFGRYFGGNALKEFEEGNLILAPY